MEVFIKNFSTYRTVGKATAISSALVLDALDRETSTVTVRGTEVNRSHIGSWLIAPEGVWLISNVKPEPDRTILTLVSPLEAFDRPLELAAQPQQTTFGKFVAAAMTAGWVNCPDPAYVMTYLEVSSSDTTPYTPPEVDDSGCFSLPDYCRLMRKSYRCTLRFFDSGNRLHCGIFTAAANSRQVSFEDGRSQLQSVSYSSSGVAKITAIHDVDTGEKDAAGDPVYRRERSDWYLSESGDVTNTVPARRASGTWDSVYIQGNGDVRAKVTEAFAKNKANHKLEFWSTLDLDIQTDCTFMVYGELLRSYISYKRKSSDDKRFYYKSGELATTASEKLKGVIK